MNTNMIILVILYFNFAYNNRSTSFLQHIITLIFIGYFMS